MKLCCYVAASDACLRLLIMIADRFFFSCLESFLNSPEFTTLRVDSSSELRLVSPG